MKKYRCEKSKAFLLTDRLTRKYFCGVDLAEGVLVITDKFTVFTDARYYSAAKVNFEKVGVQTVLLKDTIDVGAFLKENNVQELGIDYIKTTVKEYFSYQDFGLNIFDCSNDIEVIKAIKDDFETESIEKACLIIEKAVGTVIKTLKKGETELEVKDRLEKLMVDFGAEGPSFDTIVAFGANSAVPHHETGDAILKDDMVVLIDAGCKVNGYCSDITRTAFFGKPSIEFINCYNAVLTANEIAIKSITDGITAKDADAFARNFLTEQGFGEYFTHSLGHGLGQEIHEFPTLSYKSSAVLKNGMIFTIEPGVYLDGKFGIRIEDTVKLDGGIVKRLYSDDKKLIIL